MDYNPIPLLFIWFLELCQLWPVGACLGWLLCSLPSSIHVSTSLLSDSTSSYKFLLSFSWPSTEGHEGHLSIVKERFAWFLNLQQLLNIVKIVDLFLSPYAAMFRLLLLLLLSRFSRVWLCATPETAAHKAPPSLGFSMQEHWSGLPFPFPMHESENESEVAQLCPTLSDPMDYSLPGSSVHGILQARTLEWVAISFSNAWKWKVKVKSLSCVRLLATPWTAAHQAPPSMGFSRQEYWSGVPLRTLLINLPYQRQIVQKSKKTNLYNVFMCLFLNFF